MRRPILLALLICSLVMAGMPMLEHAACASGKASGSSEAIMARKKEGGGFFRALARLFGGRKKSAAKSSNPRAAETMQEDAAQPVPSSPVIEKIKRQDVARFESVKTTRVTDARTPPPSLASQREELTAEQHLARGKAFSDQGNNAGAIAELTSAISINPKLVEAHSLLARIYERIGLHEMATQQYFLAAPRRDEDPQLLNDLGYALYLNGNYKQAVERLKRAARVAPDNRLIRNNLALALFRLGKYDDAQKNFIVANGELDGHLNMATLFRRAGNDNQAIKQLVIARRIAPTSPILNELADLYEMAGRRAEAQEARRAALISDPQSAHAAIDSK
jgi:tetratricopeptide (TPR) repeat protein